MRRSISSFIHWKTPRSKPIEVTTFTGTVEQPGTANQVLALELVKMGVQKMQLLMMSTIFLGGLKDEIGGWVIENGPDVKTALKLAREVEVIIGDATRRPKEITIATLQDLEVGEEESQTVIKTLNAIKMNKRATGQTGYQGNPSRSNTPRSPDFPSGGFILTCYYCSNPGHMAKDCRKKARDLATGQGNTGTHRNNKSPTVKSIQETSYHGVPGGYDGGGPFSENLSKINTICSLHAG
jgi:hypothetical protein